MDTSPLVAILDRDDPDHARCVDVLRGVSPPLLTTWPVLTEASCLLSFSQPAPDALQGMLERKAIASLPLTVEDAAPMRALMRKYRDLPMDRADATLVRTAEREGIGDVFTLDRRDVSVYRVGRGKSLTLRP